MTLSDVARSFALCVCLIAAAVVLEHASQSEPVPLRTPLASFPTRVDGWSSARSIDFDPSIVAALGVTEYVNRVYLAEQDRSQVGLYVGYYKSQRQGESIHSPLNCLPGSGWQPI